MAYCTREDVQAEFRGLEIEAGSVITPAKLDAFISQASREIDGRIGVRFITPVTSGDGALEILKTICVWLVAPRVKEILEVKTASPDTSQAIRGGSTAKDARKMLDDIVEGKLLLDGASPRNAANGVSSFNVSNNQEHQFKRNEDQW
jgi:phage gp36-like protein